MYARANPMSDLVYLYRSLLQQHFHSSCGLEVEALEQATPAALLQMMANTGPSRLEVERYSHSQNRWVPPFRVLMAWRHSKAATEHSRSFADDFKHIWEVVLAGNVLITRRSLHL